MQKAAPFEGEALPTMKTMFARTPNLPLCAFGFACALLTWFPGRIGVDLQLTTGIADIAGIVFLVGALVTKALRPNFRFSGNDAFVALTGLLSCVCFTLFLTPVSQAVGISGGASIALETLYKLLSTALLLFWLEQADRFPVRNMLLILGAGCFILAVLELLFLGMNSSFSLAFFAFSPMLSAVVLLLFLRRERSSQGENGQTLAAGNDSEAAGGRAGDAAAVQAADAASEHEPLAALGKAKAAETAKGKVVGKDVFSVVLLCLGVFVFTIVGSLIQAYMVRGDLLTVSSTLFCLSDAAGLLLTSAVLVGLAAFAHSKTPLVYLLLIMPTLLALAYVMSIVMPESLATLSFIQLIVVRRTAFIFWLVAAASCPASFIAAATCMLAAYRAAQAAGFSMLGVGAIDFKSDFCTLLIVGELTALVVICLLISITCLRQAKASTKPSAAGEGGGGAAPSSADAGQSDTAADVLSKSRELQLQTLQTVAAKYDLSNRETEVLALLAEGWRAAAIADKLVIAQSTAKNHMNRIYGKLGVHTQDELMRLIESERKGTR